MIYDELNVNFNKLIEPLIPYTSTGLYTKEIHDQIANGSTESINLFIHYTTDHLLHNKTTICFINNVEVPNDESITNLTLEIVHDKVKFHLYSLETFDSLLSQSNNVIFQPIYGTINNEHHLMTLIIDKQRNQVMFFDSNGINDNTVKIETMIKTMINKLNIHYDYQLILNPTTLWNKENIVLNHKYSSSPIYYGGFCVILSLLIPHYMLLTGNDISSVIEIFGSFPEDKLMTIINDYSLFYYIFINV